MSDTITQPDNPITEVPVRVSPRAIKSLSQRMRKWSGWPNTAIIAGVPEGSPFAHCDMADKTFTVNFDNLILNPNRVLISVTPFRLKQEAVLTGVLLHEAAHARHSHWMGPDKPPIHGDGATPTTEVIRLAALVEEARIEGLMARDAHKYAAGGLEWTMRASAARLAPTTTLSHFADQMVMDVIQSWTLRAGRQVALHKRTAYALPSWVGDFNSLLHDTFVTHLDTPDFDYARDVFDNATRSPQSVAAEVVGLLHLMCVVDDDTGTTLLDTARQVMRLLFPETADEEGQSPSAGGGCGAMGEGGEAAPDEATGEASSGGESDEQGEGGGEAPGEDDEPGEGEQGGGAGEAQEALDAIEATAKSETEAEALLKEEEVPTTSLSGGGAGQGSGQAITGQWRLANAAERDLSKGAGKFLRDLIDPTETAKHSITDMPAANVDGAAMAAWKAGGQRSDPQFFKRTRREALPTPPVKIAIMVDISSSMEDLQKPSALLSWALSSAATDLRNFAGRGTQIESCLIHWGDYAKVIVPNGGTMPGIREFPCNQGTSGMQHGLDAVEKEMPGFFDPTEHPENRLLVQFTDWDLYGTWRHDVTPRIARLMEAGVNMLSVVPRDYGRRSDLDVIMSQCRIQRGRSRILRYDRSDPGAVWTEAARMLAQ